MNRTVPFLLLILLSMSVFARQGVIVSQATSGNSRPNTSAISLKAQTIELTLSDAIYLGLRDNRTIRSAYLERVAQKFDLRVAEDQFTPKLKLSGSYLSTKNQDDKIKKGRLAPSATLLTPYGTQLSLEGVYDRTQANTAGLSRNDGASLSIIQPLLRGAGKDIATAPLRLARLTEQQNRLNLKSTISQTITRIIVAYRELLQAQEQLKIAQAALERTRKLVEVNQAMIAAGRMARIEIVQTEAEVASQELAYEETKNQLDNARLALLQLLALDLNSLIVAAESLQATRVELNVAQALQQAESSQPDYLTQLIAGERAAINLAVAQNNQLWDVSLVGRTSQVRDYNTFRNTSRSWENYIGIQIDVPIGDSSIRQAEVQAQVAVDNHAIQLAETKQQLIRDVTNAARDIDTRWRQFEIAQRSLELSRQKLMIEREKLTLGRSSNFQVVSFENDLRNAENRRLSALISYLNAQANLDQTIGSTLQNWDITLND